MNHFDGNKCRCSVFRDKNISLKILVIHQILVEIEESLWQSRENIEKLRNKYRGTCVEKFIFHARIKIETLSMYRGPGYMFTECSISSFLDVLETYLDKYYTCFIEMLDQETFEFFKLEYLRHPYCVSYSIYQEDNK